MKYVSYPKATAPLISRALSEDQGLSLDSDTWPSDDRRDRWLEAMSYTCNAFYAIVKPLSITVILASIAAIYLQPEDPDRSNSLAFYPIADDESTSLSDMDHLYESSVNAAIIVSAIFLFSLLVVVIIWLGCARIIVFYLIFSFAILLTFSGGQFFLAILTKLDLAMDPFLFLFFLYNVTIIGVISIFWPSYVPNSLTKVGGYSQCFRGIALIAYQSRPI